MTTVTIGGLSFDVLEVSVTDMPRITRKSVWSDVCHDLLLRLEATSDPNRLLMYTFADVKTADRAKAGIVKWLKDNCGPEMVAVFKREKRLYIQRGSKWVKAG